MVCRCTPESYRLRVLSFPKDSVAARPRTLLHTVTLLPRAPKPSHAGQTFVPRPCSKARLSSPSWGCCLLWPESSCFPGWVHVCFRVLLRRWAPWAFSVTPLERTKEVSQPRSLCFWSTKAWSSRLVEILTCGNQIRVGWVGVSLSYLSQTLTPCGCACHSDLRRGMAPETPSLKTQQEVPCLMVWLTNFLVLVSLWAVGQQFGLGCKSDRFFFQKVPKLCGLRMGRFALGRLRRAQHIMQSRARNTLRAYSTTSHHVHLHK